MWEDGRIKSERERIELERRELIVTKNELAKAMIENDRLKSIIQKYQSGECEAEVKNDNAA